MPANRVHGCIVVDRSESKWKWKRPAGCRMGQFCWLEERCFQWGDCGSYLWTTTKTLYACMHECPRPVKQSNSLNFCWIAPRESCSVEKKKTFKKRKQFLLSHIPGKLNREIEEKLQEKYRTGYCMPGKRKTVPFRIQGRVLEMHVAKQTSSLELLPR